MKVSITHIVLGLGIVFAMALSIARVPNGLYATIPVGKSGNWIPIFVPNAKKAIANAIAIPVLLLGCAIIGVAVTALALKTRSEYVEAHYEQSARKRKLAIILIGLRVLPTATSSQ